MSSASRGSGTRRRINRRSLDCSRSTTSEMRWSCVIHSRPAPFIYPGRRIGRRDIAEGINGLTGGMLHAPQRHVAPEFEGEAAARHRHEPDVLGALVLETASKQQ